MSATWQPPTCPRCGSVDYIERTQVLPYCGVEVTRECLHPQCGYQERFWK